MRKGAGIDERVDVGSEDVRRGATGRFCSAGVLRDSSL